MAAAKLAQGGEVVHRTEKDPGVIVVTVKAGIVSALGAGTVDACVIQGGTTSLATALPYVEIGGTPPAGKDVTYFQEN